MTATGVSFMYNFRTAAAKPESRLLTIADIAKERIRSAGAKLEQGALESSISMGIEVRLRISKF